MLAITGKEKRLKSQLNSVEGTSHSKKKTGSAQSTVLNSYRYFDLMVDLSAKYWRCKFTAKEKPLKSQLNSVEGTSHSKKKTGSAQSTILIHNGNKRAESAPPD